MTDGVKMQRHLPSNQRTVSIGSMTEVQQGVPPLTFKDRSGRLLAAGIILIVCSLLSGCYSALLPIALFVPTHQATQTPKPSGIVGMEIIYLTVTISLVWIGIGTITKRRWSRPLIIVISVGCCFLGILACGATGLLLPMLYDPSKARVPLIVPMLTILFVLGVMFFGLPAVLLALIGSEDVQRTCEAYDRQIRWTDGLPLRILGLSFVWIIGAIAFFRIAPHAKIALFGALVTGPAAVVASILLAITHLITGYWIYRRDIRAWWVAIILLFVLTVSGLISLWLIPVRDTLATSRLSPAEIARFVGHEKPFRACLASIVLVNFVGSLSLILWSKSAFGPVPLKTNKPLA